MRSRLVSVHGSERGLSAEREPQPPPSLPEGVVTFALTDVEGSSRLWERDPEAMRAALAIHDRLVERCIVETGGVRPLEQGEGVVVAFSHASRALAFALSLQRSLASAEWPAGFELRVRIALHSGEALLRGDDSYVGPTLNRCARLRELAHGGQTLVSRATHELVAGRLPEGASLNSLGTLRLRGVGVEKEAFELSHPELPSGFPPPRALEGLSNLPTELSSFVGRERELRELAALLGSERLITLTGAGGCGKTRLALEACFERHQRYPDGTWWAELAPLSAPELVGAEIAAALGVRPLPGRTPLEAACAYLASRRALVVLDNCEHLAAASAEAAKALVDSGPGVSVLATSRAPLGVSGETDWRVPSLTLPEPGTGGSPAELSGADAVMLFCERAREARPRFELSSENADAVAAICAELDGLPLALELAAARLRVLSAKDIAAALSDRFRILAGGPRTATPRHQTLRASVEWSHDLLPESEQALLRRLSVFAGTFSLGAAEEICANQGIEGEEAIEPANVLNLIAALVDHSLVIAEESGQAVRFRLLETVRQYGRERLAEAGEEEAACGRHRDFFLALAEEVAPTLETAAQREGLEALDPEAANLAAGLDCALATEPALALRFCVALHRWWCARGRFAEAEHGHSRALAAAGETETELRAKVLFARAVTAVRLGENEASEDHATAAVALAAEAGDEGTEARARCQLGVAVQWTNPRAARAEGQRAAELARSGGDDWALAQSGMVIASGYLCQGDLASAVRANEDGVALLERIGDPLQVGWRWVVAAHVAVPAGRFDDARDAVEQLRATLDGDAEPIMASYGEIAFAAVEAWEGEFERARERLERELERALRLGMWMAVPPAGVWLAFAELAAGDVEQARDRLEGLLPIVEGRRPEAVDALRGLAEAYRLLGDAPAAEEAALRGKAGGERIENRFGSTWPRLTLGRLAAAQGEWPAAREHVLAHLDVCVEGGYAPYVPACLDALAEVAAGLGAGEDAARLFAAAERTRAELGIVRVVPEDERWDAIEARLRQSLGEETYEVARAQGAELSTEDALEWARRGRGSRQRAADGWGSLTPTELRVAGLVAEGLTNPEIAERMFVSKGTVKTHMAHIFRKLEVHSRTELGAQAARRHSRG